MKLSILDQAPIVPESTASEALQETIRLAQLGDQLGFTRYWIAEHHDLNGLACPAPEVMLGIIGQQTNTIRIGAGAVLLPHYRPYKVAETFHVLASLYPDRIDLGLGRSPGGSAEASMALSGNFLENVRKMPESIEELLHFIHQDFPNENIFSKVKASPIPAVSPVPWLLGTSEKSAELAAEKGLDYAFGHFMSDQNGPAIVQKYRETMNNKLQQPGDVIVAVTVYCAETNEEAEQMAMSSLIASLKREQGDMQAGLATPEEINHFVLSDNEKDRLDKMKQKMVIGTPSEVKEQLLVLEQKYDVDEFMLLTNTFSYEARRNSYQLVANEILHK
ncbi:luciferase family oxidoreductase, group 1 [Oceanobacillus limi]|uniref:Luciferase family oxidoreductase, group 1 n=1 Tax=Oceanobacillus limi TaxID=930131 RepID=A0A1I0DT99_9BACI|nr:LLM class flavin-dependent oxidoreductase [Oceanobacillus limi]SET35653.1 luciferase family oxidoreductase, group 1 [Oceanobacillus limi]